MDEQSVSWGLLLPLDGEEVARLEFLSRNNKEIRQIFASIIYVLVSGD
jgi:hypothetical protein